MQNITLFKELPFITLVNFLDCYTCTRKKRQCDPLKFIFHSLVSTCLQCVVLDTMCDIIPKKQMITIYCGFMLLMIGRKFTIMNIKRSCTLLK